MFETKSGGAPLSPRMPVLSVSEKRLPALLAIIAGMVDLTGFLTLGNVFTAHVTGNLVVLAAVAVRGGPLNLAQALAVPTFVLTVAAVWLFAQTEAARNTTLMRRLLLVQFLLLVGVLGLGVLTRPSANPHGLMAGVAVLVAASAMACQNALLHMTVAGAPSTAVMTGNLVSATLSLLDAFSPDHATRTSAGPHIEKYLPLLLGFFLGCVAGAAAVSSVGDWAWSLPAALAGLAAVCRWTAVTG